MGSLLELHPLGYSRKTSQISYETVVQMVPNQSALIDGCIECFGHDSLVVVDLYRGLRRCVEYEAEGRE